MMPPILETPPPLIIKVYDSCFLILWKDCVEKPEDKYDFSKIRSVIIKRGKPELNGLGRAFKFFIRAYFHSVNDESDEIVIETHTGELISRYVHGPMTEKLEEAIELIQTKLKRRKFQSQ